LVLVDRRQGLVIVLASKRANSATETELDAPDDEQIEPRELVGRLRERSLRRFVASDFAGILGRCVSTR
jgi:hypothetical protein